MCGKLSDLYSRSCKKCSRSALVTVLLLVPLLLAESPLSALYGRPSKTEAPVVATTAPEIVTVEKEVQVPALMDNSREVASLTASLDSQIASLEEMSTELETLKNSLKSSKTRQSTSSEALTSLQDGLEDSRLILSALGKNSKDLENQVSVQTKEINRLHLGLGAGVGYKPSTGGLDVSADLSARWRSMMFIGGVSYPANSESFRRFDKDSISYHASLFYEF